MSRSPSRSAKSRNTVSSTPDTRKSPRPGGRQSPMTFFPPAVGPYVLKRARVLGRMLQKPVPPVDFDGFAIVDILVDEGVIAKIVPAGAGGVGKTPEIEMAG